MVRKQLRRASHEQLQEDRREMYWRGIRQELGRNLFFLDTGAIVGSLEEEDLIYSDFLDSVISETLVTSSYVVMETVRRLVKDRHRRFTGPNGQRNVELALFVLKDWLTSYGVRVLHVPKEVYADAVEEYHRQRHLQCDLNDILSVQIVRGLQQDRIVASDRSHFLQLGLNCLPSTS